VLETEAKQMARDGRRRGGMSGLRPDTYRCTKAADDKEPNASWYLDAILRRPVQPFKPLYFLSATI